MTKEGTLLEKDAKRLFSLLGFKTQNNVKIKDYEIDAYATFGDSKIIIECKQREKSETLDLRNLIHQWNSKNSILKADKVVLIIYGMEVNSSYKILGRKLGIVIWDENDFERLFNLAIEDNEKAREWFSKNTEINASDKIVSVSPKLDSNKKKLSERLEKIEQKLKEDEEKLNKTLLDTGSAYIRDLNLKWIRSDIASLKREKKEIEKILNS